MASCSEQEERFRLMTSLWGVGADKSTSYNDLNFFNGAIELIIKDLFFQKSIS
jgi:hypothetical protein